MRIQYISDLHFENHPKQTYDEMLLPKAPVLALLGDICRVDSPKAHSFFEWLSERWETVLWIPGRLEVWGSGFRSVDAAVEAMKARLAPFYNCQVLCYDRFISSDGCLVIGCPLFCRPQTEMIHWDERIYVKPETCPPEMLEEYKRSFAWLKNTLKEAKEPTVVLTHYAPLPWYHQEEWIVNPASLPRFFDEQLLFTPRVVAWLFGHCHVPANENYLMGSAQGEEFSLLFTSNPAYQPDSVLQIRPELFATGEFDRESAQNP